MDPTPPAVTPTNDTLVVVHQTGEPAWSVSASAFTYFVHDSPDYVQPTIRADRSSLHLEARYNYEDLQTGSAWIGYNLGAGEQLRLDVTPMLGGVFGRTSGPALGYELTLGWRKLRIDSESEALFDLGDASNSFFYTWTELTLGLADWIEIGLVAQRTRAYQTDLEVQRGVLVRGTYKHADVGAYLFNPDATQPTLVLELSVTF